jgi:hypothetical protein
MNDAKSAHRLRQTLFLLALTLVFEGLLRKKAPAQAKLVLFFLKDAIALLIAFQVWRLPRPPAIRFLTQAYLLMAILFLPVIGITAYHDPKLAVFGAKQYLLFPIVGVAVFVAFEKATREEILRFFRWMAFLVVPTSLIAVLQARLPVDHWLNLSVGGTSLEGFSAGGRLRVSSSFPFVAQYVMFLNAQIFMIALTLTHFRDLQRVWKIIAVSLLPLFVVGSYITGSRGAVVANTAILLLACGLAMLKLQPKTAFRLAMFLASLGIAFLAVRYFFPEAFLAYSAREEGKLLSLSQENQGRILTSLFGWTENTIAPPSFFGYGLGVMSNGSDAFSSYASYWRSGGAWTETDAATTMFEGGFYLMIIWYSFRGYVIWQVARRYLVGATGDYALPMAFSLAYVMVLGVVGTLGIQPPLSIWWWMGVGTSLVLWWKCVQPEPTDAGSTPVLAVIPEPRKIRGRSVYAEQLHGPGETLPG